MKNMAPEKAYLESGLLRAKKNYFFFDFLILKIPDPCRNPDFIEFLPVMHFHTIQEHPIQICSESKSRVKKRYFLHFLKTVGRNYQSKIFQLIYLNQNTMVYIYMQYLHVTNG